VELPEKQGLKPLFYYTSTTLYIFVAVELPEKQGLKPGLSVSSISTKLVAVELPEKQGLKHLI